MTSIKPIVTILLPVYNCNEIIYDAVNSVKKQTFEKWQLIIIDDGSNQETKKILDSISRFDTRIHLISNETNKGIIYSLNKSLNLVDTEFIARIDCDDVWYMTKLEKQVKFLSENPDFVMVATWTDVFVKGRKILNPNQIKYSTYEEIFMNLFKNNFIVHSSVLLRSEIIKKERYCTEFIHAEDYELWMRLAIKYKIFILPEVLTKYEFSTSSLSYKYAVRQQLNVIKLKFKYFPHFNNKLRNAFFIINDFLILLKLIAVTKIKKLLKLD